MQKYDFFSITMQNAPEIYFNSPPMFQKSIFVALISVPYRLLFKKYLYLCKIESTNY